MIVYHGLPFGLPIDSVQRIAIGRNLLYSYATCRRPSLDAVVNLCQTVVIDNGAFSDWKAGTKTDWSEFYDWLTEKIILWPHLLWFLIPDSIEGGEAENDGLLYDVPDEIRHLAVPVWHMHETLERLERLSHYWPWVAIGSSGDYSRPGADIWWKRIEDSWRVIKPGCKVHGLRMCNPKITARLPFASVDSTTAGRHGEFVGTLKGPIAGCSAETRVRAYAEYLERCPKARTFKAKTTLPLFRGM